MRSIIQTEKRCYLCGSTVGLEKHHCMHGSGWRQRADRWGLTVWLCSRCHRDGKYGVHGNNEIDLKLKRLAQETFEKKYSREKWIEIFGRNYL